VEVLSRATMARYRNDESLTEAGGLIRPLQHEPACVWRRRADWPRQGWIVDSELGGLFQGVAITASWSPKMSSNDQIWNCDGAVGHYLMCATTTNSTTRTLWELSKNDRRRSAEVFRRHARSVFASDCVGRAATAGTSRVSFPRSVETPRLVVPEQRLGVPGSRIATTRRTTQLVRCVATAKALKRSMPSQHATMTRDRPSMRNVAQPRERVIRISPNRSARSCCGVLEWSHLRSHGGGARVPVERLSSITHPSKVTTSTRGARVGKEAS